MQKEKTKLSKIIFLSKSTFTLSFHSKVNSSLMYLCPSGSFVYSVNIFIVSDILVPWQRNLTLIVWIVKLSQSFDRGSRIHFLFWWTFRLFLFISVLDFLQGPTISPVLGFDFAVHFLLVPQKLFVLCRKRLPSYFGIPNFRFRKELYLPLQVLAFYPRSKVRLV